MDLKLRVVNSFDAKISHWPFQKTTVALERLKKNDITIKLCGYTLEGPKSRIGIGLAVAKVNQLDVYGHLNPNEVAGNIKNLADAIKEIKFFGLTQIDVSVPFEDWSHKLHKAIPCVLFGSPDDHLRNLSIQTLHKFYEFAEGAKTIEEKGLIAKILYGALDIHDGPSALHQEKTRGLALMIARELKLSEEETLDLEFAAYLHDTGKLAIDKKLLEKGKQAIDKKLLKKDDAWSDEDTDKMRMHILFAIELLTKCGCFPKMIIDMVGLHHVLKAYPKDINPKDLPMVLQILPVLDAYDAMTGGRYKEKMTNEEAFFELYRDHEETFLELKRNYGEDDPKVKYAQKYNFNKEIVAALERALGREFFLVTYHF